MRYISENETVAPLASAPKLCVACNNEMTGDMDVCSECLGSMTNVEFEEFNPCPKCGNPVEHKGQLCDECDNVPQCPKCKKTPVNRPGFPCRECYMKSITCEMCQGRFERTPETSICPECQKTPRQMCGICSKTVLVEELSQVPGTSFLLCSSCAGLVIELS